MQSKIRNAIAAVIALGVTSGAAAKDAPANSQTDMLPGIEKCYGIAKKGMNDCSTSQHHCAGEAKIDGAKDEWLVMPNALCKRIVGGKIKKG